MGRLGLRAILSIQKQRKNNINVKKTDVEEIPLYYDFWFPEGAKFGFMALQSFQGRSCVNLLTSELKKSFEAENGRHILGFKKIMPNDAQGSAYYNAPVKRLTLLRRRVRSDAANNYFGGEAPDVLNISVSVTATRSGSLGRLKTLLSSIPSADNSVIMHDGMEFSEAMAEIRVGKKLRRVGVFGPNTDAGTIDLSDVVVWGENGHPTFESVKSESDSILNDFLNAIIGSEE